MAHPRSPAGGAAVYTLQRNSLSAGYARSGAADRLAGLSLVFLPLTFCWAIVRYRLMDTDLIFKRGVAYTVATGLILGGYFGVIAGAAG